MTDTKKLINSINCWIRLIKEELKRFTYANVQMDGRDIDELEEIKSFLEQQYQHERNILDYGTDEPEEKQPQPDELVEKLLKIGMRAEVDGLNYADTLENKPAKMLKIFDEARAEIRTLLQSRPVVTREEIEEEVRLFIRVRDGKSFDEAMDGLVVRLKSKGIEVKEE